MKKALLATLVVLFPAAALAHPEHGNQVYALVHYLTGTHLFPVALAIAGVVLVYRLVRRHLSE